MDNFTLPNGWLNLFYTTYIYYQVVVLCTIKELSYIEMCIFALMHCISEVRVRAMLRP